MSAPAPGPENNHARRADSQRHRIFFDGRLLAGTADIKRARRLLAVLSRDGKLPGFELVSRGAR